MNATDHRREVRRIIWTLLIFGAVMSLAGNVVQSISLHGWSWRLIGPVVAAVIAPAALLGLMHLMGAWSRWTESDGVSYWVFLIGVVALGAAAFRLSFAALRDLAVSYGYSRFDASLFPLILDGLMALMTWGLVAATRPKVAKHPVDATSTSAPVEAEPAAEQTPVHPVAMWREVSPAQSVPTAETQQVESAPLRDLATASTPDPEPTSVPAHREAERDADTDEIALTSGASREAAATHRDVELPLRRLAVVPAPRRDREAEREVARSSQAASTAAQGGVDREVVRDVEPEPVAKQPAPLRDVEADVTGEVEAASTPADTGPLRDAHRDLAQRVIDAGRTTVAVEDTAAVIAAKASGLSNKKVSEATGVGESAVQRIWTAARELSESAPVA